MKNILSILFMATIAVNTMAQLTEQQALDAKRFEYKYARAIDRQDTLSLGIILTFSHSTELECIHMTDTSGAINRVVIRPRDYPGYVDLYQDQLDRVVFEWRGDGSGNSMMYFSIGKYEGKRIWLPEKH